MPWLNNCPEVAVSTSNLNGWFTAVEVGKSSMPRLYLYLKMLRELSIHIAAFQEHHISSAALLASEEVWLRSHGFDVLAHLQESGGGRGGCALELFRPVAASGVLFSVSGSSFHGGGVRGW